MSLLDNYGFINRLHSVRGYKQSCSSGASVQVLKVKELKRLFFGIVTDIDYTDIQQVFKNHKSGHYFSKNTSLNCAKLMDDFWAVRGSLDWKEQVDRVYEVIHFDGVVDSVKFMLNIVRK